MASPYTQQHPEIVEIEDDYQEQQQLEDGVDIVESAEDAGEDAEYGEDDDEEMDDDSEEDYDAVEQLCQLMVAEDGTPVADIMLGIRDALERHNKILYKAVTVLESRK
jgi:protein subunit release factor A